jgi:microcystin-dependent protein
METRGDLILPFLFKEVFIMPNITDVNIDGNVYDIKHKLTDEFTTHWEQVLADDDPSAYPSVESMLLDLIYPVGSIYWSKNATNPSYLFGGTWVQIKDKFILAAGDDYKINTSGGAATHTLTTAQLPSHTHGVGTLNVQGAFEIRHSAGGATVLDKTYGGITAKPNYGETVWNSASQLVAQSGTLDIVTLNAKSGQGFTGSTATKGGSQPHNNMPPYITAYCWERTA